MKLKKEYEQILGDIGGWLLNGKPKMRIVSPDEAKRPHGKLEGQPKYLDPHSGKQMEFLVLEQWLPASMLGTRENWPSELMGVFPGDCPGDCCSHGFWSFKSPLTIGGEFRPVTESLMQMIAKKQWLDIQWSLLDEIERQRQLDASLAVRDDNSAREAHEEHAKLREHYLTNKETLDNADNRVFVFPEKYQPNAKNIRLPIGSPQE